MKFELTITDRNVGKKEDDNTEYRKKLAALGFTFGESTDPNWPFQFINNSPIIEIETMEQLMEIISEYNAVVISKLRSKHGEVEDLPIIEINNDYRE
jgi:hypothetical protein